MGYFGCNLVSGVLGNEEMLQCNTLCCVNKEEFYEND